MKKNKIKELRMVIIFILVGIIIFGITGVKFYFDFIKSDVTEIKELNKNELFGYTLNENDTKVYKKYFDELNDIVSAEEINYEEYAKSLSKLFITDFYTLNNKITSTDIGGLEFIHPEMLENFKLNAGDTIYKYVENNIDGKRTQELPEVSLVEIVNISTGNYTYNKESYESYTIEAKWEYSTDLNYQNEMKLNIIKDGIELYIVSGN